MKLRSIALASLLLPLPSLLLAAATPSETFSIEQSTIAPGAVLKPGHYSIEVVDHLQDRFVVSVQAQAGGSRSMFIAVPSKFLAGQIGAVNWMNPTTGSKAALRGFVFKQGTPALEFVYPKDEAVSLAKANGVAVLAVDPASEGRPAELARLSNDDRQMVTLWMLTPERVSPQASELKISASKYQDAEPANAHMASLNKGPASLKRLPHTASSLPLILLIGVCAALFAGLLRMQRASGAAV